MAKGKRYYAVYRNCIGDEVSSSKHKLFRVAKAKAIKLGDGTQIHRWTQPNIMGLQSCGVNDRWFVNEGKLVRGDP